MRFIQLTDPAGDDLYILYEHITAILPTTITAKGGKLLRGSGLLLMNGECVLIQESPQHVWSRLEELYDEEAYEISDEEKYGEDEL